ncbi:MAG: Ig-like domain-containing protein, partial [Spirochaetia bacterium]|nr:Ig-like domain-containing protein [Spirochaetia bacterium]
KDKRKKSVIVAGIAVLVLLGAWLGGVIVGNAFVRVISISPSGEVDSEIMITAQFSAPVKLKRADTSTPECFTIKPPLKGKYSFENGKTVIFTPQEPLRPATDYEVSMNASKYFTAAGRVIISDKKTKFNTPYLKVADSRMFFTMDLMKNTEKEAVCEVNYNYPVDINELKKHVSVTKVSVAPGNVFAKKETTEQFLVEASEEPSRFYIRIPGIERTYENQTIKLKIEKGIQCASCGNPTKDIFEDSAEVPLRPKLNVEELRPWNTQGETSLAVRFNIPVTEEQVKKYVTVIKRGGLTTPPEPVKFTVKTEYCYALFTADFKPNISYEVAVSKAMKGKNGEIMDADYTDTVKLKDLPSSMEFSERGEVLSTAGSMNIGVKVMNLDRIFVRVHKVFKNNLVSFLQNRSIYNNASEVFSAYHDIKGGEINREETEYINLQKLNNAPYKGLFYVEIQDPKNYNSRNKVVRCTDISLIAKAAGGNNGDLIVKAISISTLQPMTGINVKLISHNNQVIKESKTDENGRVVFGDWHHNMYNFTPYLVLAENGDDFSYLTFGETQLNKYRFDVSGEPPSSDRVRAFITSERGLYRPGDTVNLTAIVRNADISTPPSMTVRCIVRGPSGESVFDAKKATDANSICLFRIELPSYAKTGQYSAVLMPNDYLTAGECTFKVEEFIPDKLVVGITSDRLEVLPGSSLTFKVKGNQ